jgi:Fic family protein
MGYIWQHPDWPAWYWDAERIAQPLAAAAREQGRLLGRMQGVGFELRDEAWLSALSADIVDSSAIEGERLPLDQVRSSLARRLGLDAAGLGRAARDVEGVVEMMLDATEGFDRPLTVDRLFDWHAALFPTGRTGMTTIPVGQWRDDRDGPMQVVSGAVGREKVHFEAPPAERVPAEVEAFMEWFEHPGPVDALLLAGLAHLWFVTIHPFADGNGRIARAIADMALARADGSPRRFYSMSGQILLERSDYYAMLERTQKQDDLDVTAWLEWFLDCLLRSLGNAQEALQGVLYKARFWERFATEPLNARQIKVLNRLLDGFEGGMTSSRWARMARCSQDTAQRDIADLVRRGALEKNPGGGRSTSYALRQDPEASE